MNQLLPVLVLNTNSMYFIYVLIYNIVYVLVQILSAFCQLYLDCLDFVVQLNCLSFHKYIFFVRINIVNFVFWRLSSNQEGRNLHQF